MSKIYTKTGDRGLTSLVDGSAVSKDDLKVEVYGTVDELNAHIGATLRCLEDAWDEGKDIQVLFDELARIQHKLFDVGSLLASTPETRAKFSMPPIGEEIVQLLEDAIDRATGKLPPLKQFILPGGSWAASYLHLARTVCRRAERLVVRLGKEEELPDHLREFLNRLSDYFFVMARLVNHIRRRPDRTRQAGA